MSEPKKPILEKTGPVIRLTHNRSAAPINAGSMLYLDQTRDALLLLSRCLDHAEKSDNREGRHSFWRPDRVHQNLSILGERGAGKTSFLLSLMRLIGESETRSAARRETDTHQTRFRDHYIKSFENDLSAINALNRVAGCSVVVGLIEPSLMEPGDNVVIAVLSCVLTWAKKYLEEHPPSDSESAKNADALLRSCQDVIDQLPQVLVRNRFRAAYEKNSTEGLYDEVVRLKSGLSLELAFADLIDKFLEMDNGRKLVVVGIDDVDLAFDRGEEVLETLRRYLTSPKVVFLVTGDLRLFEEVLSRHYLRHLNAQDEPRVVGELVEHYMKKILPPHLRVHLPDVRLLDLRAISIDKPNRPDTVGSSVSKTAMSQVGGQDKTDRADAANPTSLTFDDHFYGVLKSLVFEHRVLLVGRPRVLDTFKFLIPSDVRNFIELCDLEPPPAKEIAPRKKDRGPIADKLLFKLSFIWRETLERFGISWPFLRDLVYTDRSGLTVLNYLLSLPVQEGLPFDLDSRSNNVPKDVATAFLRIGLEAHIRRKTIPEILGLGLDLCVPAMLLSHVAGEESAVLHKTLRFHLFDSQRNLYRRLVPWITIEKAVAHAVGRMVSYPGRLDCLLDTNDPSPGAIWRWVMGNPDRRDFPAARKEAIRRCARHLEQKHDAPGRPMGASISGHAWATRYLPTLLRTPTVHKDQLKLRDEHTLSKQPNPLIPEMLPDPVLFHQLAGVLPRILLACWQVSVGSTFYLSIWHGLTLARKIGFIARDLFDPEAKPADRDTLFLKIRDAISKHVDPRSTIRSSSGSEPLGQETSTERASHPGPRSRTDDPQRPGVESARGLSLPLDDKRWGRITNEVDFAVDPRRFFPFLGKKEPRVFWPRPYRREAFPRGASGDQTSRPWKDPREIQSWNQLQACREEAWDLSIDALARVTTDWALVWMERYRSKHESDKASEIPLPPDFVQIQNAMHAFIDDMAHEDIPVGVWSGVGDTLQRWLLTFLNDVLVETQVPHPICPEGPPPARIHLERWGGGQAPVRSVAQGSDEGTNHLLYSNLERLVGHESSTWKPNDAFYLIASFPLIAAFMPRGGPIERLCLRCREPLDAGATGDYCSKDECKQVQGEIEEYAALARNGTGNADPLTALKCCLTCRKYRRDREASPEEKLTQDQNEPQIPDLGEPGPRWISYFGSEVLRPLPDLALCRPMFRCIGQCPSKVLDSALPDDDLLKSLASLAAPPTPAILLDLSGISWRGIDLRKPPTEKDKPASSLTTIDDRRMALVEMLNGIQIDLEPATDAVPYLADLSMAVLGSIDNSLKT